MRFGVERRPGSRAWLRAGLWAVLAATLAPNGARAAEGDFGNLGPAFTGAYADPSGSKPESKLWWNDGYWWASMWDTVSQDFHIFKLDAFSQSWTDTGVTLDTRSKSRADVLWDGTRLYVASHIFATSSTSGKTANPAKLYRYSYDSAASRYTLDAGFPVNIVDYSTETFVIDKDSTETLWATWAKSSKIYVSHTVGGDDRVWAIPYVLTFSGASVKADDISSLIAFGGNLIGVMWSNQVSGTMYFAVHRDGDPDNAWTLEVAASGSNLSDDHINLKTDLSGRVFAVVKTSYSSSTAPLINLLVRDPASGVWSSHVAGTVADAHTRPIVILDEEQLMLHLFATGPQPPQSTTGDNGGTIYEKVSPLSPISFAPGPGTPVIRDADSAVMNNATSTKQNLSSATGLVLLATNASTSRYWHSYDSLVPVAPTADFTADALMGIAPLTVGFTDKSQNLPTSWLWNFGDGSPVATVPNPTHTYAAPGTYTVSLTATNAQGSDTLGRPGYITVTNVGASVSFTPMADAQVSSMYPSTNFGSEASLRVRYSGSDKYRAYLRFSVTGLTKPVASAKLRLYVTNPSNDGGSVYAVGSAWDEAAINWNNKPSIAGSPLSIAGTVTAGTWIELDLGGVITADGTYSFGILNASSDSAFYSSREGEAPPQLVVTQFP